MYNFLKPNKKAQLRRLLSIMPTTEEYITLGSKKFATLPNIKKIEKFIETHNLTDKYPVRDLERWHKILTSSCDKGRAEFANENNLNISEDMLTIPEFFNLVKGNWGTEIIELVEDMMVPKSTD